VTLPPLPDTVLTVVTKPPAGGAFISPRGEINGHPVAFLWGSNSFGTPRGVHHVKIYMPWLWRFGQAEITVDNRDDALASVHYAAPYLNFGAGAIGLAPVKNPGRGVFLAVIGVPLILLAACLGATFFVE
jgi:hypothetical protein